MQFDPQVVVADRETGKSFRLDSERWNLVAGPTPEGLLVAQSMAQSDSFILVDLDKDPTRVAAEFTLPVGQPVHKGVFRAEGRALLLADETTLLLALREIQGEPGKPGDWQVFSLDKTSGEASDPGIRSADLLLSRSADGGAVIVTPGSEDARTTAVYRFDGSGSLVSQHSVQAVVAGYSIHLSPDGRWLAWLEQLPLQVQSGVGLPWHWPATMLADMNTGEVVLRVVRADALQWLGDSTSIDGFGSDAIAWQQWRLAGDDAGLLIKTPGNACAPECVYLGTGSPGGLALLRPDGTLEELSTEPDWVVTVESLVGDRVGLDLNGSEVRVESSLRAGGDSGGGVSALSLPSLVQRPPFPDEVRLRVSAGGDGLNLREQPGTGGQIAGALTDEAVVTVTDASCPEPEPTYDECSVTYAVDGWWVHVSSDRGLEGWAAAEFLEWAD
jgi:hypothetical protein